MPKVLITGANRGLGLEFAKQYQSDDWDVIATARESSPELDALGVRVEKLDMRDLDAVAAFGGRLDDGAEALVGIRFPQVGKVAGEDDGFRANV